MLIYNLAARVTVHFQSIAEKFTPHDASFSISSADELSDAALTAACSLHTAAPSSSCSSSGSSSRKKKLDEITEDAEEGPPGTASSGGEVSSIAPTQSTTPEEKVEEKLEDPTTPKARSRRPSEAPTTVSSMAGSDKRPSSSHSRKTVTQMTFDASKEPMPSNTKVPVSTEDFLKQLERDRQERRTSSQTTRPSVAELYSPTFAPKPKVKLGPRPRASMDNDGRPKTSGDGAAPKEDRSVAKLPAGLRVAPRKSTPSRPKSRDSGAPPSVPLPPPPPIPSIPDAASFMSSRPKSSAASVKSLPATMHRNSGVTPEKQRLMKALELRKKQLEAAKATTKTVDSQGVPLQQTTIVVREQPHETTGNEGTSSTANDRIPDTASPNADRSSKHMSMIDHVKADSGVEIVINDELPHPASTSAVNESSPISAGDSTAHVSTRPTSVEYDPRDSSVQIEPVGSGADGSSRRKEGKPTLNYEDLFRPADSLGAPTSPKVPPSPTVAEVAHQTQVLEALVGAEDGKLVDHPQDEPQEEEIDATKAVSTSHSATDAEGMNDPPPPPSRSEKRRGIVEPIKVAIPSAEQSEDDYLSDEDFMDELQSATFEEAKPVTVAKSPMTPFFPRMSTVTPSHQDRSSGYFNLERRPSGVSLVSIGAAEHDKTGRSPSGSYQSPVKDDQSQSFVKRNVSSGISSRIKALAEQSYRESKASMNAPSGFGHDAPSVVSMRQSSFRSPGTSRPGSAQTKRMSITSMGIATPESGFTHRRNPSNATHDGSKAAYGSRQRGQRPDSVSVTARIIRDPRNESPDLRMPTQDTPLELHQSPITIEHQKPALTLASLNEPKIEAPQRSSSSPNTSAPPSRESSSNALLPRTSSELTWKSFGRRMSEVKSPPPSQTTSTVSLDSHDDKNHDLSQDKRTSRTSRLFKRMSASITSRGRGMGALSPTLKEEDQEPANEAPSKRDPPPAIEVGDLNVQFPDTLLWKRRFIEIDGQGNIVLGLSKTNEHPRGITKRYHLTEFRSPYIPDQDRQELPNSVVLDFHDGSTLQCACEDHMGQAQVLQILKEAHSAWMSYRAH